MFHLTLLQLYASLIYSTCDSSSSHARPCPPSPILQKHYPAHTVAYKLLWVDTVIITLLLDFILFRHLNRDTHRQSYLHSKVASHSAAARYNRTAAGEAYQLVAGYNRFLPSHTRIIHDTAPSPPMALAHPSFSRLLLEKPGKDRIPSCFFPDVVFFFFFFVFFVSAFFAFFGLLEHAPAMLPAPRVVPFVLLCPPPDPPPQSPLPPLLMQTGHSVASPLVAGNLLKQMGH